MSKRIAKWLMGKVNRYGKEKPIVDLLIKEIGHQ
jgi:Zn-dependent M32 family carboxypeptidase